MIDIHSHIIPKVDDGAKTIKESIDMIKLSKAQGTNTIIATPHYYFNKFEVKYFELKERLKEVLEKIKEEKIDIEILLGQEIYLHKDMFSWIKEGYIKTLNNTRYILVETFPTYYEKNNLDFIYELGIRGMVPILAHPERYLYIQKDLTILNQFAKEGCLFQIDSGSITGDFGKQSQKVSLNLIKNGWGHFIASDSHGINKRSTNLKTSLEIVKKLNKDYYYMAKKNSELLIENKEIKSELEFLKKKKFFIF